MSVKPPPPHLELSTLGRLLAAWGSHAADQLHAKGALTPYLEGFGGGPESVSQLLSGSVDEINLIDKNCWIVGAPVEKGSPQLFPVTSAHVSVKDNRLTGSLRCALLQSTESHNVTAAGWRLDSREFARNEKGKGKKKSSGAQEKPKAPPRPFAHVQPIVGWHMKSGLNCLVHPHQASDAADGAANSVDGPGPCDLASYGPPKNLTHPAFPLGARTLPGIALALMLALYDVTEVSKILEIDQKVLGSCGEVIDADFRFVLGESDS